MKELVWGLLLFVAVAIGCSVVDVQYINEIKQLKKENTALKQQLEQAKTAAGKPVFIGSLPSAHYKKATRDDRTFIQHGDEVYGVYTYDFRFNLPDEFDLMGGRIFEPSKPAQ